ncbi:chemotaxis protein CheW [Desulfovibrio inopinatus]|uniref:chemotaxis protein CheW n=1 Tax=Desulfovibrio inopinatus TaxID=102109 RepID=UPI0003FD29C4|nr:chemotaxis protein CheW [Desulfovibrio inopinatus]
MEQESGAQSNQFLTFLLAGEAFGLDIGRVREVLDDFVITRIPRTPAYLPGAVNLRGNVLTIVDLRSKFGLGETAVNEISCIIVVECDLDGEKTVIGALADSVDEVYDIRASDILPPPDMGTSIDSRYLSGVGKIADKFIMLLNTSRLFSMDELAFS